MQSPLMLWKKQTNAINNWYYNCFSYKIRKIRPDPFDHHRIHHGQFCSEFVIEIFVCGQGSQCTATLAWVWSAKIVRSITLEQCNQFNKPCTPSSVEIRWICGKSQSWPSTQSSSAISTTIPFPICFFYFDKLFL